MKLWAHVLLLPLQLKAQFYCSLLDQTDWTLHWFWFLNMEVMKFYLVWRGAFLGVDQHRVGAGAGIRASVVQRKRPKWFQFWFRATGWVCISTTKALAPGPKTAATAAHTRTVLKNQNQCRTQYDPTDFLSVLEPLNTSEEGSDCEDDSSKKALNWFWNLTKEVRSNWFRVRRWLRTRTGKGFGSAVNDAELPPTGGGVHYRQRGRPRAGGVRQHVCPQQLQTWPPRSAPGPLWR